MPECYRCRRIQPTAELRRTSRGMLCKDNKSFSRCWKIARELAAVARRERRAARRREALQPAGRAEA